MGIKDFFTRDLLNRGSESKEFNIEDEFKSSVLGQNDALAELLLFGLAGSGRTAASAFNLYEKSSAVSVPVNMVAEGVAEITPVIRYENKLFDKHEVLDLLRSPSAFFTSGLFLETLAKDYLITGESTVIGLGNINRPPLELQPINPVNAQAMKGAHGYPSSWEIVGDTLTGSYKADLKNKRLRYLQGNFRELQHIRNYSTKDNSMFRGQSPLLSASAEARQHIKGNEHNTSMLDKGGRLSMLFHFLDDLQPDDFDEIKARVKSQYGGSGNAGDVAVTAGSKMEIKELGVNNKDMDYATLQAAAKNSVALQYKVPLPLVTLEASTFNNYFEAKMALYDDAILPTVSRLFSFLTLLLMPRFGLDPSKYQITYDPDEITTLKKRRNEELKLRREINIETIDELRADIGREPVDGGDVIRIAANQVPINVNLFDVSEPELPSDSDKLLFRD